jgi:hypothetical protein
MFASACQPCRDRDKACVRAYVARSHGYTHPSAWPKDGLKVRLTPRRHLRIAVVSSTGRRGPKLGPWPRLVAGHDLADEPLTSPVTRDLTTAHRARLRRSAAPDRVDDALSRGGVPLNPSKFRGGGGGWTWLVGPVGPSPLGLLSPLNTNDPLTC